MVTSGFKGGGDAPKEEAFKTLCSRCSRHLNAEQLSLRASSDLRSDRETVGHIIGVRARWFQFGETGDKVLVFKPCASWDSKKAKEWSAEELLTGLEATWTGMHEAIDRWTPEEWEQTWPGEDETEPEVVTCAWVIWHLLEHDVYHGGQISITLRMHRVPALEL